ncbi:MAG TPA: diguanylate cyclase [Acidimicrobiales bacterium]|nr:diguanylate cyclase [Acidimicrobiales bacterium]
MARRRSFVARLALVGCGPLALVGSIVGQAPAGAQSPHPPGAPPSPTAQPAPTTAPAGGAVPQPSTGATTTALSRNPEALRGALSVGREAALIAALGGFGQPPDGRVQRAVASLAPAGSEPAAQRDALARLDAEGQAILAGLTNPTPDVQRSLGHLTPTDGAAVGASRAISVTPEEYLRALDHLLHHDGGPPPSPSPPDPAGIDAELRRLAAAPAGTLPAPRGAPAAGVTPTSAASTPPAGLTLAANDTSSPASASLAVLAGVVLASIVAGAVLWRRRPRPPVADVSSPSVRAPMMTGTMQGLLEVSRQLTSEAATGDVDRAILRHALDLVNGQGAALIRMEGGSLRVAAETHPGLLVTDGLGGGAVRRVADTGQTLFQVSATEPAIRSLPAALGAVPLVGRGRVEAVLVVVRSQFEPFTNAEREVLLALAPVAAASLDNARQARSAIEDSLVDPLTGVGNRRRFDLDLDRALADGSPTALFMVDLDHFKAVNDTHGHPAGDAVLRGVSSLMREGVRPGDSVYRFGGEEFCVLLQRTSAEEAGEVAERVRRAIAGRPFSVGATDPLRATASFGVAASGDADAAALVARADHALYAAKQSGRNRVEIG